MNGDVTILLEKRFQLFSLAAAKKKATMMQIKLGETL